MYEPLSTSGFFLGRIFSGYFIPNTVYPHTYIFKNVSVGVYLLHMIPDEQSRLRKAEHDLYAMDIVPPSRRATLHEEHTDAPDDWAHESEPAMPRRPHAEDHSVFKKIFFGSLAVLGIALLVVAGSFLIGGSISANKVTVAITTRPFVDGGEPLPVDVTITNRNRSPLELATLTLQYPSSSQNGSGIARIEREVGNLGVGDSRTESFSIQLYGEEGVAKSISAHLEFRVAGSNVVYDRDESTDVTVRTSPVRLTLEMPDSVLPNQVVPLRFTATGNGTATLSNVALRVEYPAGFTFANANPAPTTNQNVWYFGDVPPGANREVTVNGSFAGGTDAASIKASIGSQSAANETQLDQIYNMVARTIPISTAFIDAKLVVSGNTGPSVAIGGTQNVRVDVPWQNTTGTRLTNVEVRVALSGTAYDPARVQSGSGFFDSSKNEMVWTRQQVAELAAVEPGAQGTLFFTIAPKTAGIGTSPQIAMAASVRAVDAGTVRTAQNISKKTLIVGSDVNLLARTIYYAGPIQNTGPVPPKHDTETTYTLELQLVNSRNRVTGAKVTTSLPPNVVWKNVIVPSSENVAYNTVTRELVWNAGEVPAGTTKTVDIKVGITPSSQQIGAAAPITDTFTLTARDTVANSDILITKRGLDTKTLNDNPGPGALGQVQ